MMWLDLLTNGARPQICGTIFPPTRSLPPPGRGAASGHRSLESSENGFHSGGRGGCSARSSLAVRKQSKRPRFRWLFGDFPNHDGQEGWEFYGISSDGWAWHSLSVEDWCNCTEGYFVDVIGRWNVIFPRLLFPRHGSHKGVGASIHISRGRHAGIDDIFREFAKNHQTPSTDKSASFAMNLKKSTSFTWTNQQVFQESPFRWVIYDEKSQRLSASWHPQLLIRWPGSNSHEITRSSWEVAGNEDDL